MSAPNCVGNHEISGPMPATGRVVILFLGASTPERSRPLCTDCGILVMATAYVKTDTVRGVDWESL